MGTSAPMRPVRPVTAWPPHGRPNAPSAPGVGQGIVADVAMGSSIEIVVPAPGGLSRREPSAERLYPVAQPGEP